MTNKLLSSTEFADVFSSEGRWDRDLKPWIKEAMKSMGEKILVDPHFKEIIVGELKKYSQNDGMNLDNNVIEGIYSALSFNINCEAARYKEQMSKAYEEYTNNFKLSSNDNFISAKMIDTGLLKTLVNENEILQFRADQQKRFFNDGALKPVKLTIVRNGETQSEKIYDQDNWKEYFETLKQQEAAFTTLNTTK